MGALGAVVGDRLIELDLASEDLGCPPSKCPHAHRTAQLAVVEGDEELRDLEDIRIR
jgi:hypothetical protein